MERPPLDEVPAQNRRRCNTTVSGQPINDDGRHRTSPCQPPSATRVLATPLPAVTGRTSESSRESADKSRPAAMR